MIASKYPSTLPSVPGKTRMTILSMQEVRYEGYLEQCDEVKDELTLSSVIVHGTEDRPAGKPIPANNSLLNRIISFKVAQLRAIDEYDSVMATGAVPSDPAIASNSAPVKNKQQPASAVKAPKAAAPAPKAAAAAAPAPKAAAVAAPAPKAAAVAAVAAPAPKAASSDAKSKPPRNTNNASKASAPAPATGSAKSRARPAPSSATEDFDFAQLETLDKAEISKEAAAEGISTENSYNASNFFDNLSRMADKTESGRQQSRQEIRATDAATFGDLRLPSRGRGRWRGRGGRGGRGRGSPPAVSS